MRATSHTTVAMACPCWEAADAVASYISSLFLFLNVLDDDNYYCHFMLSGLPRNSWGGTKSWPRAVDSLVVLAFGDSVALFSFPSPPSSLVRWGRAQVRIRGCLGPSKGIIDFAPLVFPPPPNPQISLSLQLFRSFKFIHIYSLSLSRNKRGDPSELQSLAHVQLLCGLSFSSIRESEICSPPNPPLPSSEDP